MAEQLTRRQSEVVTYIRRHTAQHGYPPSLREIADSLGVNVNAVAGHLAAAERKGVLKRAARVARGLTLIEGARRATTK